MNIKWGERELELNQVLSTNWELDAGAWLLCIYGSPVIWYRARLAHESLAEEVTTTGRYSTPQEAADALREALEAML